MGCTSSCCRPPYPEVPVHPVQTKRVLHHSATCPQVVTRRAYEVYCKVFGPQAALVTGECRGGFGVGELIAFLYARSFPESEWSKRVDEALHGMTQL
jgi:hypothetical protein